MDMTLVEQRKLLEIFLQTEHLAHLIETILIGGEARLGMEGVDEGVGNALVPATVHKRFQLLRLKDGIGASGCLEDIMDLTQQEGLFGLVGQFVDDEVLLALALLVEVCLYGDGTHVNKLEDTGREQVVVVGANLFIGIEHVVGLLEVTLQGDVAIPEQVFVDFLTCAPNIDKVPNATNDGHNEETNGHHD